MKRLVFLLPVLLFGALAYVLFNGLMRPAPDELPSALIGKPAPSMKLASFAKNGTGLDRAALSRGQISIVVFWASWCAPCRDEAPLLSRLAALPGITLYGVAYEDKAPAVQRFFAEFGNPFAQVAIDPAGRGGIEWGVYGVPESFVVDGRGIIRARIVGGLTEDKIAGELMPAIEQARKDS